jgi:hypothetical protein
VAAISLPRNPAPITTMRGLVALVEEISCGQYTLSGADTLVLVNDDLHQYSPSLVWCDDLPRVVPPTRSQAVVDAIGAQPAKPLGNVTCATGCRSRSTRYSSGGSKEHLRVRRLRPEIGLCKGHEALLSKQGEISLWTGRLASQRCVPTMRR